MAVGFRQGKAVSTSAQTSHALTLDSTPVAGNLLVGCFRAADAAATVTIPTGWTTARQQTRGASGHSVTIAYRVVQAGDSATVTFTTTLSGNGNLEVLEFTGTDTTQGSVLDAVNSADGGTGNITTLAPGTTGTLASADEVVVAMAAQSGGNGSGDAIDSGFTIRDTAILNTSVCGYLLAAATTALNPNLSWGTGRAAVAAIATFKGATGGSTPKSDSDTGTGSHLAAMGRQEPETAAGTDSTSAQARPSSDTAAATDTTTAQARSASDTATGVDTGTLAGVEKVVVDAVGAVATDGGVTVASLTPALPAGLSTGKTMVLVVANRGAQTVLTPNGWNRRSLPVETTGATNTDARLTVFDKVWQSGDTAPTVTFSAASRAGAFIFSCDDSGSTTAPIVDVLNSQTNAATANFVAPAVTPTVAHSLLLALFATTAEKTFSTTPSGMNLLAETGTIREAAGWSQELGAGTGGVSTGTRTAGTSGADSAVGALVVYRPGTGATSLNSEDFATATDTGTVDAGTASKADSDTATGVDTASVALNLSSADDGLAVDGTAITRAPKAWTSRIGTAQSTTGNVKPGVGAGDPGFPTFFMEDTDPGFGVDAAQVTIGIPGADSATGTDAASVAATSVDSDTATGVETGFPDRRLPDTATGTETATTSTVTSAADTGTGVDVADASRFITVTDTAVGTDAIAQGRQLAETAAASDTAAAQARQASDTATAVDTGSAGATRTATDTAVGVDAFSLARTLSDAATSVDQGVLTVAISGAETGVGVDAADETRPFAASDTATAVDATTTQGRQVPDTATGVDVPGNQSRHSAETAVGQEDGSGGETASNPSSADTGTAVDASTPPAAALSRAETFTTAEAGSNVVVTSDSDAGTGVDAVSASAARTASDTATSTDTTTAQARSADETASSTDAVPAQARSVSDAATATETAGVSVLGQDIAASDTGTGTEATSIVALVVVATDTAIAVDASSTTVTVTAADSALGVDVSTIGIPIADSDTATAVDLGTASFSFQTEDGDSGAAVDIGTVSAIVNWVPVTPSSGTWQETSASSASGWTPVTP